MIPPSSGRLAVISYLARHPFTPRGIRTQHILSAVGDEWQVELIASPAPAASSLVDRARGHVRYRAMLPIGLDAHEAWAWRHLGAWRAECDLGLLVGYPWSPVVVAARRLSRKGVPYVVDASDPWAVTSPEPSARAIAGRRAQRHERALYEGAAGAIVTTEHQADVLRHLFGDLEILVRPNGYSTVVPQLPTEPFVERRADDELHLGHFGNLYAPRLALAPFFERLLAGGRWSKITLHQFGEDWNGTLSQLPDALEVCVHRPRPWAEVVGLAGQLDFAFVLGNSNPAQLPSKTIDYLTLPVPRLALVGDTERDAIARYVADKPGWLVVDADQPDLVDLVTAHAEGPVDKDALAPPPGESWENVGREIASFLRRWAPAVAATSASVGAGRA